MDEGKNMIKVSSQVLEEIGTENQIWEERRQSRENRRILIERVFCVISFIDMFSFHPQLWR